MVSLNRRSMMQFLGISPIAAKPAMAELSKFVAAQSLKFPPSLSGWTGDVIQKQVGNELSPGERRLGKKRFEWLNALMNEAHEESQRRRETRRYFKGLDPDLAAMRSMSPVVRYRIQLQRDCEERQLFDQVQAALWGDDESYVRRCQPVRPIDNGDFS